MLNSTQIVEQIQEDAPCVYDILMEGYDYPYSRINGGTSPKEPPTADQLLGVLTEYDGDNHDVHYWSGRYAQMIETANAIDSIIKVFEDIREKLAPMMDYEYTLKIDLLKNLQENII